MTREDRIIYEVYLKTDEWKKEKNRKGIRTKLQV